MEQQKYQRTGSTSRPFRARGRGRGGRCPSNGDDFQEQDKASFDLLPVPDTPVTAMFRQYAEQLDAKNDLFEVLVKHSRDTTIESKRIIFLLIRCAGHTKESLETHQILLEAKERIRQLQETAMKQMGYFLRGEDPNIFNRAFTSGLQEYVECLSLYYYLDKGRLIDLAEVQRDLTFTDGDDGAFSLPVTPVNFLLGIGDLTGELMRFSITHAANSSMQRAVFQLCDFARAVLTEYQRLPWGTGGGKDYGIKLRVMCQSVYKIERVCYQLALRQAENLPAAPAGFFKVDDVGPETAEVY